MNTLMVSFNTTVRQMTKMSQRKNRLTHPRSFGKICHHTYHHSSISTFPRPCAKLANYNEG